MKVCTTRYGQSTATKHAQASQAQLAAHNVQVKRLPDNVVSAMAVAANEIVEELRQDDDPLVKRITQSYLSYRNLVGGYMSYD